MLFYIFVTLAVALVVSNISLTFTTKKWPMYIYDLFFTAFVAYIPFLFYSLISDLGKEFGTIAGVLIDHQQAINQIVSRITRF